MHPDDTHHAHGRRDRSDQRVARVDSGGVAPLHLRDRPTARLGVDRVAVEAAGVEFIAEMAAAPACDFESRTLSERHGRHHVNQPCAAPLNGF